MTRTRTLYITDKMLRRKHACNASLIQLDQLLGTRTRRVPVTFDTVFAMAMIDHLNSTRQLSWAVGALLTPTQNAAFWRYVSANPLAPTSDYASRTERNSRAFVRAYYSPKK